MFARGCTICVVLLLQIAVPGCGPPERTPTLKEVVKLQLFVAGSSVATISVSRASSWMSSPAARRATLWMEIAGMALGSGVASKAAKDMRVNISASSGETPLTFTQDELLVALRGMRDKYKSHLPVDILDTHGVFVDDAAEIVYLSLCEKDLTPQKFVGHWLTLANGPDESLEKYATLESHPRCLRKLAALLRDASTRTEPGAEDTSVPTGSRSR